MPWYHPPLWPFWKGLPVSDETQALENQFGLVTSKRITYFAGKGMFSGGLREDVPLKHVTSVRVEKERRVVVGLVVGLVALVCLSIGEAVAIGVGLVAVAVAVLAFLGQTTVQINTTGGDLAVMKGGPWLHSQAEEFAKAVRGQLFENE